MKLLRKVLVKIRIGQGERRRAADTALRCIKRQNDELAVLDSDARCARLGIASTAGNEMSSIRQ
jgi:hypothetical protein